LHELPIPIKLFFRSEEIPRLARIASPRLVSWTPFQSLWPSASSLSKGLVWYAPRRLNTGKLAETKI
jgi:hypothetical protein